VPGVVAAGRYRTLAGVLVDDGDEDILVFYCPDCAERQREFRHL
jgi:hypothetical protein